MFRDTRPATILVLAIAACSSTPHMPEITNSHPAAPDATEVTVPAPPKVLHTHHQLPELSRRQVKGGGKMEGGLDMGGHGDNAVRQGAYYCPMHPQVHADEPARCTHCGMTLIQRKAEE